MTKLPEKIKQFTPKIPQGCDKLEVLDVPYYPAIACGELMVKVNEIITYLEEQQEGGGGGSSQSTETWACGTCKERIPLGTVHACGNTSLLQEQALEEKPMLFGGMSENQTIREVEEVYKPLSAMIMRIMELADKGKDKEYGHLGAELDSSIHKALTTLHQKHLREKEEAEQIAYRVAGNFVGELYQSGNMGDNEYQLLVEFFDEKLAPTKTDKQTEV